MDELGKLGGIIDGLFDRKRNHRRLNKRLVFIVGNGIDRVNNIINDQTLRRKAGTKYRSARAFEAFKWRHFEYARYYSTTTLPSFAHCCIYWLMLGDLCRDLITTNYDMFFDAIFARAKNLNVAQNPVAESDEFLWEGYYSPKRLASDTKRYWKIHGSLSHICFRGRAPGNQHHLHRLPRFAISANDDLLAQKYGIPTQAPFMGYEAACYPHTRFAALTDLSPGFSPFIDWTYNNDRSRFQREIVAAKNVLRDSAKIAALVLIGFSGYFNEHNTSDPWNEELVPEIRRLHSRGFDKIFMAVHAAQARRAAAPTYGLMRDLMRENRWWSYNATNDFMTELLNGHSRRFPYNYAESEYTRWKRWFSPRGEATHA